jgi:hypothetical protein
LEDGDGHVREGFKAVQASLIGFLGLPNVLAAFQALSDAELFVDGRHNFLCVLSASDLEKVYCNLAPTNALIDGLKFIASNATTVGLCIKLVDVQFRVWCANEHAHLSDLPSSFQSALQKAGMNKHPDSRANLLRVVDASSAAGPLPEGCRALAVWLQTVEGVEVRIVYVQSVTLCPYCLWIVVTLCPYSHRQYVQSVTLCPYSHRQ